MPPHPVAPVQGRKRIGLATGDELELTVEAKGILLSPVQPRSPMGTKEGILICAMKFRFPLGISRLS